MVLHKLTLYNSKVNWLVFLFITVFTIGSWLDINGMWCELPIMVHELPEGWRLPSILNFIMEFSQMVSLFVLVYRALFPKRFSLVVVIYIVFFIGIISCFCLIYFWDRTVIIKNEERSIGLYVFIFLLGLLDGTSTITFLPYIGEYFSKEYIIPNYVGESLSAMIPSLMSIIQGVGDSSQECTEVSQNQSIYLFNSTNQSFSTSTFTTLTKSFSRKPLQPIYSVSTYFLLLFLILIICTIAFTLLHFAPVSIKSRKGKNDLEPIVEMDRTNIEASNEGIQVDNTSLSPVADTKSNQTEITNDDLNNSNSSLDVQTKMSSKEQMFLLSISSIVSFILFGFLPGIQTYSTLPYGKDVFHLSLNLSCFFPPLLILFTILSYDISLKQIFIEFLVGVLLSVYTIVVAAQSPCPILVHSRVGAVLVVFVWIILTALFVRVRCCIAAKLQETSSALLFPFGILTTVGQILGGVLVYILVETYRLFKDLEPCQKATDICPK